MGPAHTGRKFDRDSLDVAGLEERVILGEIRTCATEARNTDPGLGRTSIPEILITGAGCKGTMTSHVKEKAALELAEQARSDLLKRFPESQVWITDTTPAIGSHAGPGGMAIAVLDAGLIEASIIQKVEAT